MTRGLSSRTNLRATVHMDGARTLYGGRHRFRLADSAGGVLAWHASGSALTVCSS
jgi:hypothetical protein